MLAPRPPPQVVRPAKHALKLFSPQTISVLDEFDAFIVMEGLCMTVEHLHAKKQDDAS